MLFNCPISFEKADLITAKSISSMGSDMSGESKTSNEGIAHITLAENHKYMMDDEGYINMKAIFSGSDAIDMQEETLRIKNLYLELNLVELPFREFRMEDSNHQA